MTTSAPLPTTGTRSRARLAGIGCAGFIGLGIICVVVVSVIGALSGDEPGQDAIAGSVTPMPTITPTPVPKPAGVGDSVDVDGWIITVTEVRRTPTIAARFPRAEQEAIGMYLVVDIAMENTGLQKKSLSGRHFRLHDSEGRRFEWYRSGSQQYGTQGLGSNINPGLTAPGTLIFDLPESAVDVVLTHSRLNDLEVHIGAVEDFEFD